MRSRRVARSRVEGGYGRSYLPEEAAAPGLGTLEVVLGRLQIVWFNWFGTITARIGATKSSLVDKP